jgi:hypothetical protein
MECLGRFWLTVNIENMRKIDWLKKLGEYEIGQQEVIPYEGIQKLVTTKSLDKYIVSSNADGCLMCAIKRP